MRNNITVLIYTHNEEKNIVNCLKRAKLLTENIIVIDMESVDKTTFLAKKNGAIVFSYPYRRYVEPARRFGIEKAKTSWVFILDADERMTKELAKEIKKILKENQPNKHFKHRTKPTYYKVPRKNIFARLRWLKHGGWWPDYQIRLIKKEAFVDWPKEIHSSPKIKGNYDYLKQPLIHLFHSRLETMVEKTIVFEDIESDLLLKGGKSASTVIFFRKFLGELFRRLIKNLGFLDGGLGLIEGIYQAFSKTITYIFLYEKQHVKSLKKNR